MTTLKLLGTISLLLLLTTLSNAQRTEEAIYLKNGSVIRGKMVKSETDRTVRIQCADRNIWAFDTSEIKMITTEMLPKSLIGSVNKPGYFGCFQLGFMGGKNENGSSQVNTGLNYVHAYQVSQASYGGGIGIEFWDFAVMPLYTDFRYNFLDGRASPYLHLTAGYAFSLENNNTSDNFTREQRGGFSYGIFGGIKQLVGKRAALVFSAGYRYQKMRAIDPDPWNHGHVTTTYQYNRIEIKIGLTFH